MYKFVLSITSLDALSFDLIVSVVNSYCYLFASRVYHLDSVGKNRWRSYIVEIS